MRYLFIVVGLLSANVCFAKNRIDSLRTKKEVNDFLIEKVDTIFKEYPVFGGSVIFGTDSFYKTDIDGDGLTDLIVNAGQSIIIIDKKKGNYEYHYMRGRGNYYFYKTLKLNNLNALLFHDSMNISSHEGDITGDKMRGEDTIIYKYGRLFDYHSGRREHKINKLYYTTRGWGAPTFGIEIHQDGNAFFVGSLKDNGDAGKYIGWINDSLLRIIYGMINELDIENDFGTKKLPQGYTWEFSTDLPDAQLDIWYDSGKHVSVSDYGMDAAIGLRSVYDMFEELTYADVWKPWGISNLSDSAYLSISQLFKNARNKFGNWYSEGTYRDTIGKIAHEPQGQKTYYLFDTAGIDMFDTINISGNHTYSLWAMSFLQLDTGHHFVFGQTGQSTLTMMSAGAWKLQNDSTIELNWDEKRTVSAVRDSAFCERYFHKSVTPVPLTIEAWKLVYRSKNKKLLKGLGAKKDEEPAQY